MIPSIETSIDNLGEWRLDDSFVAKQPMHGGLGLGVMRSCVVAVVVS